MKLIDWQYYPKWGLSYQKDFDKEYRFTDYYVIIGPFQFRFRK